MMIKESCIELQDSFFVSASIGIKKKDFVMRKFLARAFLGMFLIFCVNYCLAEQEISLHVGLNGITFLTSGTLGLPGVLLLYGISALEFL